jgi:hypothetical protein
MTEIAHDTNYTHSTVAFVSKWENLQNGDTGEPRSAVQFTDRSVQVFGTFGVGGSVTIEGSNDGVNWAVLTDPQGNDLVISTAKIELISEATVYVRPVVGGDGTTDLTVLILLKE